MGAESGRPMASSGQSQVQTKTFALGTVAVRSHTELQLGDVWLIHLGSPQCLVPGRVQAGKL